VNQSKVKSEKFESKKDEQEKKIRQVRDLFNKICKSNPRKLLEVERILLN
jgi:hypothetical protein